MQSGRNGNSPRQPGLIESAPPSVSAVRLPRAAGDRILLAVMAVPVFLAAGLALYTLRTGPEPASRMLRFALMEIAGLVFSFSGLALLWAAVMPQFIERAIEKRAMHVAIVGFTVCLGLLLSMVYLAFAV